MRSFTLAIVGGGPMATYAMERLAALLPSVASGRRVEVKVFEATGRFGDGAVHSAVQPSTSRMNRIACQIALGADETNAPADELLPKPLRPTFDAWCARKLAATGNRRFAIDATEMPPRNLHGQALSEQFEVYRAVLAEAGVTVSLHAETVVDVRTAVAGGFEVVTAVRREIVDHILFVTGHGCDVDEGTEAVGAGVIPAAYPLERRLTATQVPPGARVAVDGMGLTAIDVILYLTEGRGGRFDRDRGGLAYRPSGLEPALIIPFGPSGYFVHSRPRNDKAGDPAAEHRGVFFTEDAVAHLRRSVGMAARRRCGVVRQLDFARHAMPLVALEMAYVYYRALLGEDHAACLRTVATPVWLEFLDAPGGGGDEIIDHLIQPLQAYFDDQARLIGAPANRRFDWRGILAPIDLEAAASGPAWREAVMVFMDGDLREAALGNVVSPIKAACDGVWRDLRSAFSAVADDGGLTPSSHRDFQAVSMRFYNRLSNGAGRESLEKILALIKAGRVDLSVGPEPRCVASETGFRVVGTRSGVIREATLLVQGKISPFDPDRETGGLYRSLIARGLVRKWVPPGPAEAAFAPGALDLSERFHPVIADGLEDDRLTFLGAPAEGARFFQTSAARPFSGNYILNIVAAWARGVRQALTATVEAEECSEPSAQSARLETAR